MGQYYKPVILNQDNEVVGWVYSHNYDSGLKLMEHSWLKNKFVQLFEGLISPSGQLYKSRVVWAGDYADEEQDGTTLYGQCGAVNELKPKGEPVYYRYVVNHTKKQYVDKETVPNNDGWVIHPLPLLTCEGNGRGGGDFHTDNKDEENLIGSWARDVISVENNLDDYLEYQEINFNLQEKW